MIWRVAELDLETLAVEPTTSYEAAPIPPHKAETSSLGFLKQRLYSDGEMADQLQSGNADALTVLFKRHSPVLFSIARRILRNDAEAEDAVQQIFLDVFRSIHQFNPEKGTFKSWLLMFAYHVKISELLLEVDNWTGFTKSFTHLKSGETAKDRIPLLTTILANAINLGRTKMTESCHGTSYAKLSWLQAWHIRDETYATALAELVNAQFHQPFAENRGDGTTSSSDGQRFKAGGKAESTGHINPKYGSEPGKLFYTHISD